MFTKKKCPGTDAQGHRLRPRRKTAPKTQQLSAPTTDVVLGPEDAVGGELGLGHAVGADLGLDDAVWVEPSL